jgi:polysaccharide pyruvyl transferase WcaK-like protein
MQPLTIEIHGTGVHNRGAELMTLAIADRLRTRFGSLRIVVPSVYFKYPRDRHRYGLHTTWEFGRRPLGLRRLVYEHGPRWMAQRARMVSPREIDLVLDAAGFAYSDQWGPTPTSWLLAKMSMAERRHQPLIFLPQAFGPFTNRRLADRCRQLFDRAELIFARDGYSHRAVQSLRSGTELRQCPDFTIGIQPEPDPALSLPHPFVAVVPNIRMLDKTSKAREYLEFLNFTLGKIRSLGWQPIFVIHDATADLAVIRCLDAESRTLPVIRHQNPRVLKWVLGQAHAVVASRFHALVASLSQGVPSLGVGWSHKYPELFDAFKCANYFFPDIQNLAEIEHAFEQLADTAAHQSVRDALFASRTPLLSDIEVMWHTVEARIEAVYRAK